MEKETIQKYLDKEIQCLNHGFIRLVDYMGSDSAIVQAARVSYGSGTKTLRDDTNLIRYLLRHKHTTPFEMCEIKLHIKCPIFVARQWLRHRTANVNEYSARYSIMENEYYIPQKEQVCHQSNLNKQGRNESISEPLNQQIRDTISKISENSFIEYENLISEEVNLTKELSRTILPVNIYTQFYWKIDLHNLLHFLKLRIDEHAQYEIRVFAKAILSIIKIWVPITYEAFVDYTMSSYEISSQEIELLKKLLKGEKYSLQDYKISKRELARLKQTFEIENL